MARRGAAACGSRRRATGRGGRPYRRRLPARAAGAAPGIGASPRARPSAAASSVTALPGVPEPAPRTLKKEHG